VLQERNCIVRANARIERRRGSARQRDEARFGWIAIWIVRSEARFVSKPRRRRKCLQWRTPGASTQIIEMAAQFGSGLFVCKSDGLERTRPATMSSRAAE
jgi:hypothetical protein